MSTEKLWSFRFFRFEKGSLGSGLGGFLGVPLKGSIRVKGLRFKQVLLELTDWGLEFWVWGLGLGALGLRFWVWGLGLGALGLR